MSGIEEVPFRSKLPHLVKNKKLLVWSSHLENMDRDNTILSQKIQDSMSESDEDITNILLQAADIWVTVDPINCLNV